MFHISVPNHYIEAESVAIGLLGRALEPGLAKIAPGD
jgi:hypothetical protein